MHSSITLALLCLCVSIVTHCLSQHSSLMLHFWLVLWFFCIIRTYEFICNVHDAYTRIAAWWAPTSTGAAGAAVPIESYHTTLRPSWLLLLLLIVDQLVYRAVLLLRHIYHPAHAFYFKKMKNVSCEYDWLNGWNSTLQATWYIGHVRWECLFYNNTPEYWKTSAVSTTDRWLKLNFASCLFYNSFI